MIAEWLAFYGAQLRVAATALAFRLEPVETLADSRAIGQVSFGLNQGLLLLYALGSILLADATLWWATLTGWLIGFGANALILYVFWLREAEKRAVFWRFVHTLSLFGMLLMAIGLALDLVALGAPAQITQIMELVLGIFALAVVIHIGARVFAITGLRAAATLAIGVALVLVFGVIAVLPFAGPEAAA